jgi:hypothetical protein
MLIARAQQSTEIHVLQPATRSKLQMYSGFVIQITCTELKESLLFIHGATGYDMTSALFGKGKKERGNFFRQTIVVSE